MDDQASISFPEPPRPQPTGRLLLRLAPGTAPGALGSVLTNAMGIQGAVSARDLEGSATPLADAEAAQNAVVIDEFNVAIVSAPAGEDLTARALSLRGLDGIADARPEFYLFAINQLELRYGAWLREAASILAERGAPGAGFAGAAFFQEAERGAPAYADTDEFTWGLFAVGANRSRYAGRGIKIAVLDTGVDAQHPDLEGRIAASETFVGGTIQDVQGHGTHCAGTALGPARPSTGRRYGVACEAELHVGKVLNDNGSGSEGDVLLGMRWAIGQKCEVISMSLGRPTVQDEIPDPSYEEAGRVALAAGSLIVAAAGNESRRELGYIAPVGSPANATTIMAVAAVDSASSVAYFSCGGIGRRGGEIDVAAPGVAVYSAFPQPRNTRTLDGTSMACPHVAGIAALWAESDASLRGQRLWEAVQRSCRPLPHKPRDVGAGLAQVPDVGRIA